MGSYLTGKILPKIKNMPREIEELINYYKRYNLETHVFNATTDLQIPVVMSLVLDRTGIGESVNLGAKSGESYLECIRGSLFEVIQPRRAARMTQILNPDILKFDSSKPINGMEERYAYWRPVERINDLDFWLNSSESVDYNKLPKKRVSLNESLKIMRKGGFSVYLADITLPPVREKGFESLKVLIPQLHPLYLAENAKALYSTHYGEIPDNSKLKPHPFT